MTTIQENTNNIYSQTSGVNFKSKYARTDSGMPYYKTNLGLKVSCATAGFGAAALIYPFCKVKSSKRKTLTWLLIPLAFLAIGGAGYDSLRNRGAKKAADEVQKFGVKNAMRENENLGISKNGNVYYKSNDGLKWGTIAGMVGGLATSTQDSMNKGKLTKTSKYFTKAPYIACCTVLSGLACGGVGAILDYFTNEQAYKNS